MSTPQGAPSYLRGTFQQTCGYCGCVFLVAVPGQIGSEGPQIYRCPECHKGFPVRASGTPTITLISKRTDGRRRRYPEGEH